MVITKVNYKGSRQTKPNLKTEEQRYTTHLFTLMSDQIEQ